MIELVQKASPSKVECYDGGTFISRTGLGPLCIHGMNAPLTPATPADFAMGKATDAMLRQKRLISWATSDQPQRIEGLILRAGGNIVFCGTVKNRSSFCSLDQSQEVRRYALQARRKLTILCYSRSFYSLAS